MRRFPVAMTAALSGATARRQKGSVNKSKIVESLCQQKVFEPKFIEAAVTRFLDGLSKTGYANHFSDEEVSAHIQGLLTAEARQEAGGPLQYVYEGKDKAFYICSNEAATRVRMVRRMAALLNSRPEECCCTRNYLTADDKLCIYTVVFEKFSNPTPQPGETDLDKLSGQHYAVHTNPNAKKIASELMARLRTTVFPVFKLTEAPNGGLFFTMATTGDNNNYIASLIAIFQEIEGVEILRCASSNFSNGMAVYSFELRGAMREQIEERASLVPLLPNRPYNALTRMHEAGILSCQEAVFLDVGIIFAMYFTPSPVTDDYVHIRAILQKEPNGVNRLNSLRQSLTQEMMSERYTGSVLALYPEFCKMLYDDFKQGSTPERRADILNKVEHRLKDDQRPAYDLNIFKSFVKFNEVVVKHNFFKSDKAALAFRLDPAFLGDLEYPRIPHGLFLLAGGKWRGFHIRFTDIARGGVRMIMSKENMYRKNKRSVFQENYNLAHTQLLKNKDIPEGGSKGTILVSSGYLNKFELTRCKAIFLQYVDALLDVIIPGETGVVDNLKQEEIIFLGPDENTAGSFPAAGALYSKARGYSAWKSFTTGKDAELGGIPHDEYGMTTHSVRTYVKGVYEKLGLDETKMRKFQTGGPDGDLGSNEIKKSSEIMVGMVDISASLHDPNGIDRTELNRLATERLTLRDFDRKKLSKDGFLVLMEDKNVTLPDGTLIEDGARLRDEFHFLKYSDADVFVPCGGRPRSVTLSNVGRFLKVPDATGEAMLDGHFDNISPDLLKFKIVVEGANLFITQDARLALERCGVTLIKDASANKGGVTSSSLEVYAGLCLNDEEHAKYMSAKSAHDAPEFYKKYVQEILDRIEHNARLEFEAIWREWEKNPAQPKTLIADQLSSRNVQIRATMLNSDIFKDKQLVRFLLDEYTPETIKSVISVDTIMERVPVNYQHAICAMWLASRYVYSTGIDANEFDFFRYMTDVNSRAAAASKGSKL